MPVASSNSLISRSRRDTLTLVEQADIPSIVKHFVGLRTEYRALKDRVDRLEKEVDDLSHNLIPSIFQAQHIKTINIDDVGKVSVNQRWTASMPDKELGMGWLRGSGNEGLIISTVNAGTLAAFAKERALGGEPLPESLFTVGIAPYTSITKVDGLQGQGKRPFQRAYFAPTRKTCARYGGKPQVVTVQRVGKKTQKSIRKTGSPQQMQSLTKSKDWKNALAACGTSVI